MKKLKSRGCTQFSSWEYKKTPVNEQEGVPFVPFQCSAMSDDRDMIQASVNLSKARIDR
jgi:hypothetical protein